MLDFDGDFVCDNLVGDCVGKPVTIFFVGTFVGFRVGTSVP